MLAGKPLNWIQIEFYNTDSDFHPTQIATRAETYFYIKSIEITGAAPPAVPGDYNINGVVDAGDYVFWRKGGPLANEVDTPGTVNAADYTAWRGRFGNTPGAGSGLAGSSVPEPGSLVLMVAAATGVLSLGLRKR